MIGVAKDDRPPHAWHANDDGKRALANAQRLMKRNRDVAKVTIGWYKYGVLKVVYATLSRDNTGEVTVTKAPYWDEICS